MKLAVEEAMLVVFFGKRPTDLIYQRAIEGDKDAQARVELYTQSCDVLLPEFMDLLAEMKKELA